MITLVIGGPGSGKSIAAEEIVCKTKAENRYYLATMMVYDKDGADRIEKHRKQREGKGFITLELPYRIDRALGMMDKPQNSVVLLECISNLVGNEMYENAERSRLCKPDSLNEEAFVDEVMSDIKTLSKGVRDIVIVTNEYEPSDQTDEMTRIYIKLIDLINEKLIGSADSVVDVRKTDRGSKREDI